MTQAPASVHTMSPTLVSFKSSEGASGADWLDFWASVIGSVVWPLVVLLLLFLFRAQLLRLVTAILNRVPEMESLKTPWGEAVWSKSAVAKVSKDVDATLRARSDSVSSLADGTAELDVSEQLARIQPSAGVINAFLGVEREVRRYLELLDLPWRGSPVVAFRRAPQVPNRLKGLVNELAQLRNAAAHGQGDITIESALEYISSSQRVADQLGALADELAANRMSY